MPSAPGTAPLLLHHVNGLAQKQKSPLKIGIDDPIPIFIGQC
jgi:hypothetical protein